MANSKKHPLILLFCLCLFSTPLLAQWEWENPKPDGYDMRCVDFSDSLTGWSLGAVCEKEYIGGSWELTITEGIFYSDVKVLSQNNVWAARATPSLRHYDGSAWSDYAMPTTHNLFRLHFLDANHGWAVGDSGTILFYNGINWSLQPTNTFEAIISAFFLNDSIGWAGGYNGTLFQFRNGIWSSVDMSPVQTSNRILSIAAGDTSNIFVSDESGKIKYFNGVNWAFITLPLLSPIQDIEYLDSAHIWVLSRYHMFFYDGANWSIQLAPKIALVQMCMLSPTLGWAVGAHGAMCKWDGTQWTYYDSSIGDSSLRNMNGYSIAVPDSNNVAFGLSHGGVTQTNGVWDTARAFMGYVCYDIDFIDTNFIWFSCNTSGNFIKSGSNWSYTTMIPGVSYWECFGVDVVSEDHVWNAVGIFGIWHYNRGIWTNEISNGLTGFSTYSISMIDTTEGWACGSFGKVLHYQGGVWDTIVSPDPSAGFYEIVFTDANHGWMVGKKPTGQLPPNSNLLLFYFYDGTSWTLTDSFPSSDAFGYLFNMQFLDKDHGYLASGENNKYYEFNHGVWHQRKTNLAYGGINGIYFTDTLNGWICGAGASILRTRTGGILVGIDEINEEMPAINSIQVYPNPTINEINFYYKTLTPQHITINLFDITGRQVDVLSDEFFVLGEQLIKYNCSNLKPGTYIYQFKSDDGRHSGQIIVQ